MEIEKFLSKLEMPQKIKELLCDKMDDLIVPETRQELIDLAMGGVDAVTNNIYYDVKGKGIVREAYLARCKNGIAVNFEEAYMRRREPGSMVIADELPTDKSTYEECFGEGFDATREATFDWLKSQDKLICLPFYSGNEQLGVGYPSLLIAPGNAGFFALALADMQGFVPASDMPDHFKLCATVFVAPPFRHTHFDGKQVVVHKRTTDFHEVYSYNLYPGPSAKKGIYAVLLDIGERENWVTLHASTVKIVTPYELEVVIMHEGASGGGKSEMLEEFHRQNDGRLLLGTNTITGEMYRISITDSSDFHPVTDDMALCPPSLQKPESNKLVVADAEDGWFMRVDNITHYGTEPNIEYNTIHPKEPLLFLNIDGTPNATCLIWEPIMDAPNQPCSNPRVIIPRDMNKNVVKGAVEIDVRSFGLRQPPTTKENPNFGIAGMFHVLPPALAWLWRLVAPRGFANPSIAGDASVNAAMKSEGVGSYWPFATGQRVKQGNLLLDQILSTLSTRYILIPNQHIGAYKVGFAGQWATREYLSRRGGAKFKADSLENSRCALLGYTPKSVKIDGMIINNGFLQVHKQLEVGIEGYDAGAEILNKFFKQEVQKFLTPDINPLGAKIIKACLNDATVEEYYDFIPKL